MKTRTTFFSTVIAIVLSLVLAPGALAEADDDGLEARPGRVRFGRVPVDCIIQGDPAVACP